MKILHISDVASIKSNGVADVVPCFVKSQSLFCETALFDLNNVYETNEIIKYNYSEYKRIKDLPDGFNKPDFVVFHEVYKPRFAKLYLECRIRNIKYAIVPHGCMTKNAQNMKKLKKTIFNFLFFKRFFSNASCIQYLSLLERDNSFVHKNSFIVGNGYEPQFEYTYFCNLKSNYFIYVGRYNVFHKGLDILIDACEYSKKWFRKNKLKMYLYGSPMNEQKEIEQMVKDKNLDDFVIVNGPIYGEEKIKMITNSIAFVQTSRFEGLPQGISEALNYGVPCIVTKGSAFREYVEENECGIGVDATNESLNDAFIKLFNNKVLIEKLSKNALKNSRKDFSWDNIGKIAVDKYKEYKEGK